MKSIEELLADAISLLMHHEQHKDKEWLDDYEQLCKEYSLRIAK